MAIDLSPNESQVELQRVAHDFFADRCPPAVVREIEEQGIGYQPAMWQEMAERGWLGRGCGLTRYGPVLYITWPSYAGQRVKARRRRARRSHWHRFDWYWKRGRKLQWYFIRYSARRGNDGIAAPTASDLDGAGTECPRLRDSDARSRHHRRWSD